MTHDSDDRPDAQRSQPGSPGETGETRSRAEAKGEPRGPGARACDGRSWEDDRRARREARHEERRQRREGHRHGRKERVLHTRISEQLSDDIRRLAEDLRVPTSNLVRNVLEEVFAVVETVSQDVGGLFEEVLDEAEAARSRIRRRSRDDRAPGREGSDVRQERRAPSWADVAEAEIRRDEANDAPFANEKPSANVKPGANEREPRDEEPSQAPRPAFEEVVGWQPLILNQTQDCARCGHSIRRGSRAFVGQTERGLSRIALCRQCLHDG